MRILVNVGHPGHVHFYRNAVQILKERGHEVVIAARDKDVTLDLLDHYRMPYQVLSGIGPKRWHLYREFAQREWALFKLMRQFRPDVVTEIGGVFAAPVCKLLRIPSVIFTDTEHVAIDRYITYPLATVICTPHCFQKDLGARHVRYNGYHELAYLHPDRFKADPSVLNEIGLTEDDPFFIVRFVSWAAGHDANQRGFTYAGKKQLVETLSQLGRVIITSESPLPTEFEPFRLAVAPSRLHDLLYYATLYIGEGATTASEAAVLGTPAIYVNTLTAGTLTEQEKKYGLIHWIIDERDAINLTRRLVQEPDTRQQYSHKRDCLLADKIDVTNFICGIVGNYA
jgi:uncharacterized protein